MSDPTAGSQTLNGRSALEGRIALVSGAAGGIGRATVRALRGQGATVVGFDRVAVKDEPNGGIVGDVGDAKDVARAVRETVESFGGVDLLVHAAGITRDQVLWKLPVDEWDEVLRVNLRSAFLLLREVFPSMRERGGGRIVFLGSINGSRGKFGQSAYAASKSGLLGLARSAAKEGGRFGITVNVVEPGMVETPMIQDLSEEIREAARAESPLGQLAQPEDIAEAIVYLTGPGGRHVTGQILRVDGGQYC